MKRITQEEKLNDMMKRPIPKKKVGIVHLQMVKEGRLLYGLQRFTMPQEAVEMVKPLFRLADREMVLVMSLSTKLEPLAVEIVAVGGLNSCMVDSRDIFKHSILNNSAYVMCFHNHPSGDPIPSEPDRQVTKRLKQAGDLLGIPLIDHIVIGESGYYSFKEMGEIEGLIPEDVA